MRQFKFKIAGRTCVQRGEDAEARTSFNNIEMYVTIDMQTVDPSRENNVYDFVSLFYKPLFVTTAQNFDATFTPPGYIPIVVDDIKVSYILSRITTLLRQQLGDTALFDIEVL